MSGAPRRPSAMGGDAGAEMYGLIAELYPICRSITGDGVRRTLAAIGERIPVEVSEVPSGTPVFDWTVPDEWNICVPRRDSFMSARYAL